MEGEDAEIARIIAMYKYKEHAKKCAVIMDHLKSSLKVGMTSAEASQALGDAEWLESVHDYYIGMLGGWIPVDIGPQWAFCMHLHPNEDEWSNHVVYFSISSPVEEGEHFPPIVEFSIIDFLEGRVKDQAIRLHQFALCYPGKGHGSSGRIERFPPFSDDE